MNNNNIDISDLLSIIPSNKVKMNSYHFLRNVLYNNSNLSKYNKNEFFENLIKFAEHKSIQNIATLYTTEDDIEFIKKAAELRDLANKIRKRDRYEKRVLDYSISAIKGIAGEFLFSKYLYENFKYNKHYQVCEPDIASMNLDKRKQDFSIEYLINEKDIIDNFTFDVKTQVCNAKNGCVNIDKDSFDRIKKQSSFFIACILSSELKAVKFYLIDNEYFYQNANFIESNGKVTNHYALPFSFFKSEKKLDSLIDRLKKNMETKTIIAPTDMSREERRKFILSFSK